MPNSSIDEMDFEEDEFENDSENSNEQRVYLPGQQLNDDEELICDESAYKMLHAASTGSPCLSFDIIDDALGEGRTEFPMTAYIVAGTQSILENKNNVIVMKWSNLRSIEQLREGNNSEDDSNDDDSDAEDAVSKKANMASAFIKHEGCVNRIRYTKFNEFNLIAAWGGNATVNIWEISDQLKTVDDTELLKQYIDNKKSLSTKPLFSFSGHRNEGFALDWSKVEPLTLATGDCNKDIHIWRPADNGKWTVDQVPLLGHTKSVEDLQWSPSEKNVLASCSVDKSIRVWDVRAPKSKACVLTKNEAHLSDINVINWNRFDPFIASGGDDGCIQVWDLRNFIDPLVTFNYHNGPISSIEWNPNERTIFATAGGIDDTLIQWDLSVERDEEDNDTDENLKGLSEQLMFIHQGQNEIKELHWHRQLPGVIVSTAGNGFNIFKTISV